MKLVIFFFTLIGLSLISCENESPPADYQYLITKENLALETIHVEMLEPIVGLKSEQPKIYWFVVSWLNTQYKTPNWNNYNNTDWKAKTKERGIDCSGFARVMQQEVFNKKIRGGSKGVLKNYCNSIDEDNLKMGDLVFFRARRSKNNRIVHMGVYLMDGNFVHATSRKSAARGLGLMISSLKEKKWKKELVTGGSIKERSDR